MARFSRFWHLLGALDAAPELAVSWDAALYDEPETGQYWAYVLVGDQLVAKISNARPIAFVLSVAPPVVNALLNEHHVNVAVVLDLNHPTIDISLFLQHVLEHPKNWTANDVERYERRLQNLQLNRDWNDNTFVIFGSDKHGQLIAVEHAYLPLVLTVKLAPAALNSVLQEFGQHMLTVDDWSTPTLSIDPATAPDLIERLPLFGVHDGDLDAFSAEQLISWLA